LFLKHIFSLLLQQKVCEQIQISNHLFSYFGRIRILDATVFQVPNALENVSPGSGGCAQTAGIKIQLEYDLHSGKFLNFQVGPGKNNDKTFGTECLDTLRPGDLCIRDLGYFSLEDLDQMDQRGTYYISRLKLNTNVYVKNPTLEYFKNGAIKYGKLIAIFLCSSTMFKMRPRRCLNLTVTVWGESIYSMQMLTWRLIRIRPILSSQQ